MPTTNRVQSIRFALQMAEFATKIGSRIRDLRLARKETDPRWTQDYAARQIRDDLTGAQYARWERGEVMPREDTLKRIADVFDVEIESLYAGTDLAASNGNGSKKDELPYKAVDVQRSIEMNAKLDALLEHFGIEWMTPEAATKRKPKRKK
jgi:transcriptional regulator with XRE-family HTH domain